MSLYQTLIDLGFRQDSPGDADGDFLLQDDSDGAGPYIKVWRSAQPCPFPELLREQNAPE